MTTRAKPKQKPKPKQSARPPVGNKAQPENRPETDVRTSADVQAGALEVFASFRVWGEAREVPLDLLVPTEWNCNEMGDTEFAALIEEIEELDFDEPCQIVPIVDGELRGKFLILGGEHRYKSCVALNRETVPCVLKDKLDPTDKEKLMEFSVRRNNIRGRVNVQKYASIEAAICRKRGVIAEVARGRLMARDETIKALRKMNIQQEAESSTGATAALGADGALDRGPATDGEREEKKTKHDRKKLLESLKSAEQEVLLQSGDTVEHGYLFFSQGGKNHLVVEETAKLYALVKELVSVCKNESGRICDFMEEAFEARLKLERGQ